MRAAGLTGVLLVALGVGSAGAQDFRFPDKVAGASKLSATGSDKRGSGYSVRYVEGAARYDMFIYDDGFRPNPEGQAQELAEISQAFAQMRQLGLLQSYRAGERFAVGSRLGRFSCQSFQVQIVGRSMEDSLACVTGVTDTYVKLRASGPAKSGVVARARAFLSALAAVM